eukprot:COSAG06_NODE_4193_length_4489_cov_2.539180_2_plen_168_part_00
MLELENGVGTPTYMHRTLSLSLSLCLSHHTTDWLDYTKTTSRRHNQPNHTQYVRGRGNGRRVVPRARVGGARGNPSVLAHDLPWDGGRTRVPEQPGEHGLQMTLVIVLSISTHGSSCDTWILLARSLLEAQKWIERFSNCCLFLSLAGGGYGVEQQCNRGGRAGGKR